MDEYKEVDLVVYDPDDETVIDQPLPTPEEVEEERYWSRMARKLAKLQARAAQSEHSYGHQEDDPNKRVDEQSSEDGKEHQHDDEQDE